jgi:arylsulfatase A-like enzyme
MRRYPVRSTVLPTSCWLLLLAAGTFASSVSIRAGDTAYGEQPPHVLLIVADDLGFSDLSCFGGEIRTPHLDRLAQNGLRMTRLYNSARCCPSRAAILTGQYPHRVGLGHMVQDLGQPGYRGQLADSAVTVGQVLQQAGYRTFMAGKWHLGTDDPTRHGFEEFFGTLISARTYWKPDGFLRLPRDRAPRTLAPGDFHATAAVTDYALDFLQLARQTPDQPWFLYLAYHAPHFPLHAPAELIQRYVSVYEMGWDAMRSKRLERMGGPGTYHSVGSGWANASNTPWRMYKHYCHEGGIRTPGVIHWPATLQSPGRIEHRPGHVIDLLPTLIDVMSVAGEAPDRQVTLPIAPAGRSLLPLWRGDPVEPRLLFVEHEGHRAVFDQRWKLVAVRGEPWELYDLENDPTELADVSADQPEIVERFQAAWDRWAEENQVTPFPRDYRVQYLPLAE